MKSIEIRAEAELDIIEAALWYENERAERDLGTRMAMVERFPYGIYFLDEADKVTLFGVLHLHRNPETWKQRR